MRHIVQWGGGITSWAVARGLVDVLGPDAVTLLFADVKAEDPDLYRFNVDASRDLGVPVTVVADGRTPHEVAWDTRYLGNSRIAPCSHLLKQEPCRAWLEANTDPADTMLYVGIDWSEIHRLPAIETRWAPWSVDAPLTRPPYRDKRQHILDARARGLVEPQLYGLGFPHNNCGGMCVRAGQAQWAHLLRVFPDRFAAAEAHETRMRAELGADVAYLRDRTGKTTKPLPLSVLRKRVEASTPTCALFDTDDWGGCGCMTDPDGPGTA